MSDPGLTLTLFKTTAALDGHFSTPQHWTILPSVRPRSALLLSLNAEHPQHFTIVKHELELMQHSYKHAKFDLITDLIARAMPKWKDRAMNQSHYTLEIQSKGYESVSPKVDLQRCCEGVERHWKDVTCSQDVSLGAKWIIGDNDSLLNSFWLTETGAALPFTYYADSLQCSMELLTLESLSKLYNCVTRNGQVLREQAGICRRQASLDRGLGSPSRILPSEIHPRLDLQTIPSLSSDEAPRDRFMYSGLDYRTDPAHSSYKMSQENATVPLTLFETITTKNGITTEPQYWTVLPRTKGHTDLLARLGSEDNEKFAEVHMKRDKAHLTLINRIPRELLQRTMPSWSDQLESSADSPANPFWFYHSACDYKLGRAQKLENSVVALTSLWNDQVAIDGGQTYHHFIISRTVLPLDDPLGNGFESLECRISLLTRERLAMLRATGFRSQSIAYV